jgi:hypothetical protein
MKYERPTLNELSPAICAVRNSMNKGPDQFDSDPSVATTAAYEADE